MRTNILIIALLISVVNAFGQNSDSLKLKNEVKFESVSLSSGQGALSSGVFFEGNFSRGNDAINLTLGNNDLYAYYLKSFFKNKVFAGPCIEYFYDIPTVSGIIITHPLKHVSTFSWLGYSAGTPGMEVELTNWRMLFYYQSASFNYGRFTATGAILYYDHWQQIIDFKYTQPLTKNINLFTSAGYNFFDGGKALLKLGITYKR